MKIAFVLIDTLTSQYQKCKDLEAEFTKKRANAEATVQQKGKAFATQVQEFQRKAQSNQYTQNEYNNEQARLQKVQQDIQELQARLSTTLQEDYQKEFQALTGHKLKQSCIDRCDEAQQAVQPFDAQTAEHSTDDECACPNDDILHVFNL